MKLPVGASQDKIVEVYRHLVQVWHPDRFPNNGDIQWNAHAKFAKIIEAYTTLVEETGAEEGVQFPAFGIHTGHNTQGESPGVVEGTPIPQAFTDDRQNQFEALARDAERQLKAETDPSKRLEIARAILASLPALMKPPLKKELKAALKKHLKNIAPDVHERLRQSAIEKRGNKDKERLDDMKEDLNWATEWFNSGHYDECPASLRKYVRRRLQGFDGREYWDDRALRLITALGKKQKFSWKNTFGLE